MKKTHNQEMIQELMDEGDYAPLYPFVLQSKLSPLEKLLVSLMLNDIRMNGTITWKHTTYADKLASSRQVIMKLFRKLEVNNILIPSENNKQGGKSNIFSISFTAIQEYTTCNQMTHVKPETSGSKPETSGSKPETFGSKPETSGSEPETFGSKPETADIHIKKYKETNKENNKENNKESLKGEITSFDDFMKEAKSPMSPKELELDLFLKELDI